MYLGLSVFLSLFKGFAIGAGMIIPIGAQNAYLLNLGIKKNFHLTAATVCILCDIILMSIGVFGGGALISSNETVYLLLTWLGIIFLLTYGSMFFHSFYFSQQSKSNDGAKNQKFSTRKAVVFTTLAVTLLNPHVYLDTVVIIGSISGQYIAEQKVLFFIGIVIASISWFYALSLAAAKMSSWLSTDKVQRCINLFVALIMWAIAISLFWQLK